MRGLNHVSYVCVHCKRRPLLFDLCLLYRTKSERTHFNESTQDKLRLDGLIKPIKSRMVELIAEENGEANRVVFKLPYFKCTLYNVRGTHIVLV